MGDSAGIQQCLCLVYNRNDYTLVARELEEALSHWFCQPSPSDNVCGVRVGGILHLPVCNSQDAAFHLFPILIP